MQKEPWKGMWKIWLDKTRENPRERLQKGPQERLQKEPQERLQKGPQERLQKELQERLQKGPQERLQKGPQERLQKGPRERLQKEPQRKTQKIVLDKMRENPQEKVSKKELASLRSRGYLYPVLAGQGAHAAVYRALDEKEGIFRACKVSREKNLWNRERELLRRIKHPLFPAYQDSWQADGCCFLVMEYVPGESLDMLLRRRGRLTQKQAVWTARALAEGLAYLEELPEAVLFRDLKPENIMVREDGAVKLVDFGCACLAESGEHSLAGTPGYAAPEQMDSRGVVGAYSDVYSFGRLLHYMLTGDNPCLPPSRKPPICAYDRKLNGSLEQLVEECVREEAGERPPDMRYVLRRLKLSALSKKKRMPEIFYEKNIYKSNGS